MLPDHLVDDLGLGIKGFIKSISQLAGGWDSLPLPCPTPPIGIHQLLCVKEIKQVHFSVYFTEG